VYQAMGDAPLDVTLHRPAAPRDSAD
jgi:hypothetical protein